MTETVTTSVGRPEVDDETLWLVPLRSTGAAHDDAVRRLHELLLRAAQFEVRRRARSMGLAHSSELEDLAMQSADDALVAVLGRLESFEQRSLFTTWAYKFAVHISGVAVRKLAWQGRDVPTPDAALAMVASDLPQPSDAAEQHELLRDVMAAIATLTPRQREVVLALCISGVPIDVLAERLGATRGAIYKCLHDARQRLRTQIGLPSAPLDARDTGAPHA